MSDLKERFINVILRPVSQTETEKTSLTNDTLDLTSEQFILVIVVFDSIVFYLLGRCALS